MKFVTLGNCTLDISQILAMTVMEDIINIYMKRSFERWDSPCISIEKKKSSLPVKLKLGPCIDITIYPGGKRFLIPIENIYMINNDDKEDKVFVHFLPIDNKRETKSPIMSFESKLNLYQKLTDRLHKEMSLLGKYEISL